MHEVSGRAPGWGLNGLRYGIIHTLGLLPGSAVFGMAFGTVAAQKGLSVTEAALMSAFVFTGAGQFVAMEIWSNPLTLAIILTMAAAVTVVGLRMVLMGATLRPWLGGLPPAQVYPVLLINTDATWLIATRYREEGGNDVSVLLGSGLALWVVWLASTIAGHMLGNLIADPQRYGIDLILPIFFMAMLVPLWRGPRRAVPWAIAGGVALAVHLLVPGYWYVFAGALAGSVAGGLIDD